MDLPPFSARNRGAHAQIDHDCPQDARTVILHLLHDLVKRNYVDGWESLALECQRLARLKPQEFRYSGDAREAVEKMLNSLPWEKVFDLCERLHNHLVQERVYLDSQTDEQIVTISRVEAQNYFADQIQRILIEENLAFEFSGGLIRRRGRRHTADRVARAELVLGDVRLSAARAHFNKALRHFRNVSHPDPENVVKEAVCAVEATARALFPNGGNTLGDVIKSITGPEPGHLPKAIAHTFHGLYGFRGGGEGISHGGAKGGIATAELAEYALAVAASQIVLLVDVSNSNEGEVPV
jgi:hypothetical protein